jgi:hypothetical protein
MDVRLWASLNKVKNNPVNLNPVTSVAWVVERNSIKNCFDVWKPCVGVWPRGTISNSLFLRSISTVVQIRRIARRTDLRTARHEQICLWTSEAKDEARR